MTKHIFLKTARITIKGVLTGWAVTIEIDDKGVRSQFCETEEAVKAFIASVL